MHLQKQPPLRHALKICATYRIILYRLTFEIKLHGRMFSL